MDSDSHSGYKKRDQLSQVQWYNPAATPCNVLRNYRIFNGASKVSKAAESESLPLLFLNFRLLFNFYRIQ
jgi:hypothetical protein